MAGREDRWSEAIAVGSSAFVDKVKSGLGVKAMHREVVEMGETLRQGLRGDCRDSSKPKVLEPA
jgi:hypothetical protein